MNFVPALFRSRYMLPLISTGIYIFLYVPIIVLVLFSCNDSDVPFIWQGFSLRWYHELWHSPQVWDALTNSFIIATSAVVLSVGMSLLYVFYGTTTMVNYLYLTFYASLATPEIVLAVGLLSFFSFFALPMGLVMLIAGHTLLGLGYAIPIIHARYQELDKQYLEASLDLGASEGQTLWYIMIPLLRPALLAAALIVFVLSLDDFIISFLCSGGSTQTLPIYIFVMIRSGATPVVNALSTVLLVFSSILVLVFSSLHYKKWDLLQ